LVSLSRLPQLLHCNFIRQESVLVFSPPVRIFRLSGLPSPFFRAAEESCSSRPLSSPLFRLQVFADRGVVFSYSHPSITLIPRVNCRRPLVPERRFFFGGWLVPFPAIEPLGLLIFTGVLRALGLPRCQTGRTSSPLGETLFFQRRCSRLALPPPPLFFSGDCFSRNMHEVNPRRPGQRSAVCVRYPRSSPASFSGPRSVFLAWSLFTSGYPRPRAPRPFFFVPGILLSVNLDPFASASAA